MYICVAAIAIYVSNIHVHNCIHRYRTLKLIFKY